MTHLLLFLALAQTATPTAVPCGIINGVYSAPQCNPVVPAVTEEYGNPGYRVCDMGACTFVEGDPHDPGITVSRRTRLTCLDKRRVLVTTEAGTALCILFPEAQSEWSPVSDVAPDCAKGACVTPPAVPSQYKHCKTHRITHGVRSRTCKAAKKRTRKAKKDAK